jgi:hypothetical protein
LTLQRRCTRNFLRKDWWWFYHHSFLLRASSRSSQSRRERDHSGIFLWLVIITKRKLFDIKKKRRVEDRNTFIKKTKQTHESSNSNIWSSKSLATDGFSGASVGIEVLEEAKSFVRFLFFSRPLSSKLAGRGDVVESLSSREPSASSPS